MNTLVVGTVPDVVGPGLVPAVDVELGMAAAIATAKLLAKLASDGRPLTIALVMAWPVRGGTAGGGAISTHKRNCRHQMGRKVKVGETMDFRKMQVV